MSIKLAVVSKKEFKNGKTDNMYHVRLKGNGVNHILVNTLRRVCLDLIPIHAFNPLDIQIKTNTSVYNNDILRLRLSTFPIYNIKNNVELVDEINSIQNKTLKEDSLDKLQIFFSKKNMTTDIYNLTTDDCEFYMGDKKINSVYNTPLLIVKLKPGQEIQGNCKSSIGIGLYNGIYNTTQICCYEEINDNEYILKLESRGQISEKDILKRACLVIETKFTILKEKFSKKMLEGNELELSLVNEDHTLGNLLTHYLQEHKSISYAGYKIDHPLERVVDITLKSNGSRKMKTIILDTFDDIINIFKKVRNLVK